MALVDYQNKVIYWDEVNWKWLPFVNLKSKENYYFVKNGKGTLVTCADDVVRLLTDLGFSLSPILNLGVFEVSRNTFLYNCRLYTLNNTNPSMSTLISLISGMSKSWSIRRIASKGILSKNQFSELFVRTTNEVEYNGKVYGSYSLLAKDLGISHSHMSKCISKGMSIDEIVEEYNSKYSTDHLGNKFNTRKDMLKYWGISSSSYQDRINKGWSLEKSLTTPIKNIRRPQEYTDFKGSVFPNATSMAKEYGVALVTLLKLLNKGNTPEEATYLLSQRASKRSEFVDHLGVKFSSRTEMLETYGVNYATFYRRLEYGWSLEEALTGKRKKKIKSNK